MALYVRYNSWYISLPSSVKQQREMTKLNRREPRRVTFKSCIFFKFYAVFHNQFQDKLLIKSRSKNLEGSGIHVLLVMTSQKITRVNQCNTSRKSVGVVVVRF